MNDTRAFDRQGILMIAGCVLALGLVGGLVLWVQARTPQLDPVTLQAVGKPVTGEVAVLLDVTDPLSPTALTAVTQWLHGLELGLVPNERLTLWVLGTGADGVLQRAFARCYPGRVTDRLFHNPEASTAQCDSLFSRPLREAVISAAAAPHFPRSPILEAVREISSQPEFGEGRRRQIVLISDLFENTPALDFYHSVPSCRAFEHSPHGRDLRADLRGVTADVLYLPRGPGADELDPRLVQFWRGYLGFCGAGPVRLRRI